MRDVSQKEMPTHEVIMCRVTPKEQAVPKTKHPVGGAKGWPYLCNNFFVMRLENSQGQELML